MAFEVSSVPLSLTTIPGFLAPQFGDTIQLTCDPQTGERGVDHQGQAFSGEVMDGVRMRKRRPLTSVSATKSSDQRKLRSWGTAIGARVPRARLRPPRFCAPSASLPCRAGRASCD